MLHIGLNKPEYNLSNADIAGSKTQVTKFVTTREPSNPLNPVYKLASFKYIAPEPPKFVRDAMTVDDIEGSKPLVKKEFAPRDTMKCFDIQGATSRKAYVRKSAKGAAYNNISYLDVTRKSWQTKRSTNPLNPSYSVWD